MADVTFKWNKSVNQIIKETTGGDATLSFMANEAYRLMWDFTPTGTQTMKDTAQRYVENGEGIIYYVQDYSAVNYYGEGRHFNKTEKAPNATAHWDKAMMQVHKDEFIASVQKHINRRWGK